jgi:hypothetical protein
VAKGLIGVLIKDMAVTFRRSIRVIETIYQKSWVCMI